MKKELLYIPDKHNNIQPHIITHTQSQGMLRNSQSIYIIGQLKLLSALSIELLFIMISSVDNNLFTHPTIAFITIIE